MPRGPASSLRGSRCFGSPACPTRVPVSCWRGSATLRYLATWSTGCSDETGGNPLALLELPTALSPDQLHGTAPMPQQLTLTAGVERAFLDRARRLSEAVQTLLLVAAADSTGRVDVVRHAAECPGRPRPCLG